MMRATFRFLFAAILVSTSLFSETARAGWTEWVTLGGTITSDPAACTIGNWTFVVARGTDNRYYYRRRYLPTGVWDGWKMVKHSFAFSGAPGVACIHLQNKPTLIVSGITSDSSFYLAYFNDGEWAGWGNYRGGARVGSGPSIQATNPPFQSHWFVRHYNNTLYYYNGVGSWTQIGGYVSADPGSAHQSAGHLDLVVRSRDGYLRHAFWEGGIWYGLYPVGGPPVLSGGELVSRAPGSLDLFARGQGNVMLHKRWSNGTWGPWLNLGGKVTSGPGATVYANKQRMMVFTRWDNGQLYYRAWAP